MKDPQIPPCPHLPQISTPLPSNHTRKHRANLDIDFYIACLELAQSHWLHRKPSQAILQINKSLMANLPPDHKILQTHPIPYQALRWLISQPSQNHFIGNPVRHFQHLASRMSPTSPQPHLRTWRAWTCFHLAEGILPSSHFPRDHKQIQTEQLHIPPVPETLDSLALHSPHDSEIALAKKLLL